MLAAACGDTATESTQTTPTSEVDTSAETSEDTASTESDDHADDHEHDTEGNHIDGSSEAVVGVDASLFLDGALVGEPVVADCTLSDGSASQCYTITVPGTPVNHDAGPFCPTSTSDGADAGGLWLDGEASYEIDGEFFTELADIYGDEAWNNIVNDDGSINVIDNAAEFQVAARPDITEEYYYHCVDGDVTWLDAGEQPTHTIQVPVAPVLADAATAQFAERAHSTLGVTLNGALLSGSAEMDAILSSYTIAAFDDCGGNINPALGYHVHGTAGCSDVGDAPDGETPPFAYAIDGFTVHAPYDDAADVELDECNGHFSDEYGYHYHAAPLEQNATLSCVMGLTAEGQNAGGGPGPGRGERPPRPDEG